MKGKYNSLYRQGELVINPLYLFYVEGGNSKYGAFEINADILDYVVYRTFEIDFGEVKEYLKNNSPKVIAEKKIVDEKKRYIYEYNGKKDFWECFK